MNGRFKHCEVLLTLLGLSSCVSTANYQTARTLEPGKVEIFAGTSMIDGNRLSMEANDNTDTDKTRYSISEVGARVGVASAIDVGMRFLGNGFGFESKYRLSDAKATLSTAVGFGYAQSTAGDELRDTNINVRDVHADFFASVHFASDYMALYASPRLYNRALSGSESGTMLLYYYSLGIKAGKFYGAYLESDYLKSSRSEYSSQQYSLGFFFSP